MMRSMIVQKKVLTKYKLEKQMMKRKLMKKFFHLLLLEVIRSLKMLLDQDIEEENILGAASTLRIRLDFFKLKGILNNKYTFLLN